MKLDHGLVIVGYGVDPASGVEYWKIRNSWDKDWVSDEHSTQDVRL